MERGLSLFAVALMGIAFGSIHPTALAAHGQQTGPNCAQPERPQQSGKDWSLQFLALDRDFSVASLDRDERPLEAGTGNWNFEEKR